MKQRPLVAAVAHAIVHKIRNAGRIRGGSPPPTRGPELAPSLTDGAAWTTTLAAGTAYSDATGLHFVNSNPGTMAHDITLEDNATYEVIYEIVVTSGSFRWQLYGATTAHSATTASRTASGIYTEQVTTDQAGSLSNKIRANPNGGAQGSNNIWVKSLSVKKVL